MPKFFDPVNHPKKMVNTLTIYGSILTLSGTTTNGHDADIYINGIKNTVHAIVSNTSLTTTATVWVAANYAFYYAKGYVVSSAAAVITVVPRYSWDTVNRINVTIVTDDTLTGSVTGVFEPDLAKAKIWQVTFGQHIAIRRPKNMVEGDRIRLELNATGNFTTTFPTDSTAYYFPGGTEYVQTTTTVGSVEGVVNLSMFPREDRVTLSVDSAGSCTIKAGGVTKTATRDTNLNTTASNFVTANAAAYAAVGITLTASSAVLIFKAATKAANYYAPVVATTVSSLVGTVVNVPEGRILMDTALPNIIQ